MRISTTAQRRLKYHELFGKASHSNHKDYLFRRVEWRMQALAQDRSAPALFAGQITQDADLRLCSPSKLLQAPPLRVASAPTADPRVPAPGTLLVKRYKKDTISVTVLEHGFQYGERIYKSLSAIAR